VTSSDSLRTAGGRTVLRLERVLPHPPEKVWRAITTPEHLDRWFPIPPRFELRAGAEITFGGAPDGRITDVEPPELFAFSWGTDHLRWEIRPDGTGSVLVLHHAFDDHHGAASFASGWSACVEGLGQLLAGETVAPTTEMTGRHEEYVAEFDLDRPEIDGDTVRVERQLVGPEAAAREVLGDETDGWEFLPGTGHGARAVLTRTVPDGGSAERTAREARADVARLAHALAAPACPGIPVR
jgi:uncharacterized protein YndB with AHSA1/START domain